jgi:hypothetical protein
MSDYDSYGERHLQRRGPDQLNPIQRSRRELRIRLVFPPHFTGDIAERPAKNMDYTLKIGKKTLKGKTDGKGVLRQALPGDETTATLILHVVRNGEKLDFWTLQLRIGELPPGAGIPARLNNLGLYACDDPENIDNQQYLRANVRFAALFGESSTDKITGVHGG